MRPTTYITLIYGILVFLSGTMDYQAQNNLVALFVETGLGTLFLINIYFMRYRKAFSEYVAVGITLTLSIYYGYLFSTTTAFFPGLLTFIGAFIIVLHLIRIFNISTPD